MNSLNEAELIRKMKLVEALYVGGTTVGEKDAAAQVLKRMQARLKQCQDQQNIEYTFTFSDAWQRKLFVALLRRYEIRPYRYRRQRYTTVMARVPKRFVDENLWPEYQAMSDTLREYLEKVTDRVISEAVHKDCSDAEVVSEPKLLGH